MDFSEMASEMINKMLEISKLEDQMLSVFKSTEVIIGTLITAYQQGFVEGFTQAMTKEGEK